jgi:hypothetical protein
MAWTFPASEVFTETPLLYSDAGFHWYQIKVAHNLAQSGALFGYDPFFNAGYIGGIAWNGSARVPVLIAVLFGPRVSEVVAYKVFAFGAALLAPATIPFAARWFGTTRAVAWAAGILGLLLWWVSMFRWFDTAGMTSFVLLSFISLPYVAALWVNLRHKLKLWPLLGLGVVGGFAIFAHPLFPIGVVLGVTALLAVHFRSMNWKQVISAAVIVGGLALACNLFWLVPTVKIAGWFSPGEVKHVYQRVVDPTLMFWEMVGRWSGYAHGAKVYTLLALLSGWACVVPASMLEAKLARSLALAAVLTGMYAFLGAAFPPIANIEPNRFAPVAYLFLLVPASLGLVGLARTLRSGGTQHARYAAFAVSVPGAILGAFIVFELTREISYGDVSRYGARPPQVTGEGIYTRTLLRWLRDDTKPEGRVLFEESPGRIYDGARIAGYLAYKSGREFIGGPYPFRHFAAFWDNWLFDRPISQLSPEQLDGLLRRYNIGWAIVHSPSAKALLERVPGSRKAEEFQEVALYALDPSAGFFELGSGKVRARDHNHLEFEDVHGDRVILRYHYFPGVEVDPPAEIHPIRIGDDPTPFIELIQPQARFTLRMR